MHCVQHAAPPAHHAHAGTNWPTITGIRFASHNYRIPTGCQQPTAAGRASSTMWWMHPCPRASPSPSPTFVMELYTSNCITLDSRAPSPYTPTWRADVC